MPEIGHAVANSSYDIVAFQEVWHKGDFEILKSRITKTLPYNHYYYSGTIGSGLCIFSKWPICETLYHKFDPNGYPHKIQHGDWFGGKGVGLAKIRAEGFLINVYITHLHAEYLRMNDEYLAHRVAQAFNMSQFIKFTSPRADLVLLCGDLNLEPVDLGYKVIRCNSSLSDAWLDKKKSNTSDKNGYTADSPGNSFCCHHSPGKRIDYILYAGGEDSVVVVEECSVTMGTVPGKAFNFSDHEAVEATFTVDRRAPKAIRDDKSDLTSHLEESLEVITKGLKGAETNGKFFIMFAVASLLLAYVISVIHIPFPLEYFVTFFQVVLVLAMGFGVIHRFITIRGEVHGLETAREDIRNLLDSIDFYT